MSDDVAVILIQNDPKPHICIKTGPALFNRRDLNSKTISFRMQKIGPNTDAFILRKPAQMLVQQGVSMNIKRGLFRLWLVLSILFAIAIFAMGYSQIKAEFDKGALLAEILSHDLIHIPVLCAQTRGKLDEDYFLQSGDEVKRPWQTCWYKMPSFRALFPEYKDMSDEDLATKTYEEVGRPLTPPKPWQTLAGFAGLAFGLPLAVLVIGSAFVWAFSGFSRPRAS
ncbi:hypothetical protein At1D1108_26630 [Agrobacterium tumefaciens]|nr:hypothetical protein At1D1108_26630 [Agrobacterium tumefaciens]